MQFTDHDREFSTIRANDSSRGGLALQLVAVRDQKMVAEVFYSDTTGEFTISVFERDLPLTVIEHLTQAARVALLPEKKLHGI